MAALAGAQLLPLWALLLAGAGSFWGGLYLMAVRWAGVPPARLGLSRATPSFVVCLELLCTGTCVRVCARAWLDASLLAAAACACCGGCCMRVVRVQACAWQSCRLASAAAAGLSCARRIAGAFVTRVLPAMWLGHSVRCMAGLLSALAVLALHLAAFLQDPGYTRIPDTGVCCF